MPPTQVRGSGGFDPGTDLSVTTITDSRRNASGARQGARAGSAAFAEALSCRLG
jgi:hypothetical protein